MISPTKKLGWMVGTAFTGVLAVLMLLQFTRAMAVDVQKTADAWPADVPHQADAVTPGIAQAVYIANAFQSNYTIIMPDGVTYTNLLTGELGTSGGSRFDLVLTPDGKTAAISNFEDSTVFLIDISNPIAPSLITSVTLPMFAEDMDISADGKYLLVADGGFSKYVVSIDIASATIVDVYTNTEGSNANVYANSVSIAPDGTVIVANYFNTVLHTLLLDDLGQLTFANTYSITYPIIEGADPQDAYGRPVNVGIAPDGQTVLVCDAATSTMPVYQIIAPGVLTLTNIITDLQGAYPDGAEPTGAGSQSVAFNDNGDKAYVHVNSVGYYIGASYYNTGTIGVLNINGPGQVSLEAGGVVSMASGTSQLFGVDTMAIANNKLYVSCPTLSGCVNFEDSTTSVYVVDLADYSLSETLVLPYYSYSAENEYGHLPVGTTTLPVRLELNKTVSSPSAKPGDTITYTIAFTNIGVISATNGLLTDDLGDFIADASFTSSGVELTQEPGSRFIWHLPDLGHNAGGVITITGVLAKPLTAGVFTNTATLIASWVTKTASVPVEIEQVAPEADAGSDQTVPPLTEVTLDGSGSSDPNGDALIAYQWTQTGGETVTLSGADTAYLTFTTPSNEGVLTFTLVVTDANGLVSLPDEVVVNNLFNYLFLPLIWANPSP